MSRLDEILAFNEGFVNNKAYEPYRAEKYPRKKMVVVTCMDTRLTELLPRAMNLKNGDAKIIKTAGALIFEPFGGVMRSVLVAVTLLKAEEVYVVGHLDCGMTGLKPESVLAELKKRGVSPEKIDSLRQSGADLDHWLTGCSKVEEGVMQSVNIIRTHPLFPPGVPVHGLTIDPANGKLRLIFDGRKVNDSGDGHG